MFNKKQFGWLKFLSENFKEKSKKAKMFSVCKVKFPAR
jgi:hypothetical protein